MGMKRRHVADRPLELGEAVRLPGRGARHVDDDLVGEERETLAGFYAKLHSGAYTSRVELCQES
jgi:hypothetical protein